MASTGIDRFSGAVLKDWAHVEQSLWTLYATRIGSRVMRRIYGAGTVQLLGENLVRVTIERFVTAIIIATELWEPRFKIKRVIIPPDPHNSPETLRQGHLKMTIVGEYRPRGHLGDPTPEPLDRTMILEM
jgi:phage baseplate assembly protein W